MGFEWQTYFAVVAALWTICGFVTLPLAWKDFERYLSEKKGSGYKLKARDYVMSSIVCMLLGPIMLGIFISEPYD